MIKSTRKKRILLHTSLVIFLSVIPSTLNSQSLLRKYVDSFIYDKKDVSEPQLLVYPTIAYAPETTWEIGLSSLYVYYANKDVTNRLSEITGFTFFTLENQYGLWFDHAIYSDKDEWFFLGRLRFQSFPLLYHGIGTNTPVDYTARVDANQVFIKERVLRKLRKDLFLGLEVDFQSLSSVDFIQSDPDNTSFQLPLGSNGSTNLGLGLGLVTDTRHNVLNVRDGFFSELAFLHSNNFWGSDFTFTSITTDSRFYKPVGKNNVFAAQVLGQFNFGDVPFNQLAQMGGESMMRGYYFGRYRDNNQIATQIEFRALPIPFSFTNRIGAAVFAGTGTVFSDANDLGLSNLKFSAGAGLRFLLFPKKDIWTRFDYAITNEGGGFYLFIGESF
jgi:outer membrane protein assembly factor BamA